MNLFNETLCQLLYQLKPRTCVSGSTLGEALGVSRTAIWKQISQLIALGVPIQRHKQIGYELMTASCLLDEDIIRQFLEPVTFHEPLRLQVLPAVNSTNRQLKEMPRGPFVDVCCAEMQTAGHGRFGRPWHSPFGENIYCSARWHLPCDLSFLAGLSLVVSLAVMTLFDQMNISKDIFIKWPNDLLWQGKKLCGILIEVVAESNGYATVIIGVGINVNSAAAKDRETNPTWTSLHDITGKYFDRNRIIALLLKSLEEHIQRFMKEGFTAFLPQWEPVDYLKDKPIQVVRHDQVTAGIAQGIDEQGQLVVRDENMTMHFFSTGDASIVKGH